MEDIIAELESKSITKKAACEALGFTTPAGNPQYKKLDQAIHDYKVSKKADKKVRAAKRREAFTDSEVASMVTDYLAGSSLSSLSDFYYRSVAVIKAMLDRKGALLRRTSSPDYDGTSHSEYFNPLLLPEQCIVDSHKVGSMVWSSRYAQLAKVISEVEPGVYRIFMSNDSVRQYAYQPVEELGNLDHLVTLGVQFKLQD